MPSIKQAASIHSDDIVRLAEFQKSLSEGKVTNLSGILPGMLCWEGKPYTLEDHLPFESLFSTHVTAHRVYRTARQLGKSTNICARGIVLSALIPRFKSLYVTPLYEQVRKLSSNYFRQMLEDSPIRDLLVDRKSEQNVLQRTFKNQSRVNFGYALLSADRLRGIPADRINFDEMQDIDHTLVPVIRESLSHSKYGIIEYTGTPKTLDGNLEVFWEKSSQAEWVTKCTGCNHWNIPAREYDLDKMIGGYREDISEASPGVICARCGKPINPRTGRWRHRWPERISDFAGYHIPQIIIPVHYANPIKWKMLLGKREGAGSTTIGTFYNEVLGEAYDQATKLVSKPELERAGCLHMNTEEEALKVSSGYVRRCLAADWGGGGEEGVSLTAVALLGMRGNGKIDTIYGKKLVTPHDHFAEGKECLRLFNLFRCNVFAHDFCGAGGIRQSVMVHLGLPLECIIPVSYVGALVNGLMTPMKATLKRPLEYYQLNKTRSLQITCYALKFGWIRFFKYDYKSKEEPGLLHDFLALLENKVDTAQGSDRYQIIKSPTAPDDFAQAVNIGACTLWNMNGHFPNFAEMDASHAAVRTIHARQARQDALSIERFATDNY